MAAGLTRLTQPGALPNSPVLPRAQMAELVDAPASGAGARKGVEVRVLFWAPTSPEPCEPARRLRTRHRQGAAARRLPAAGDADPSSSAPRAASAGARPDAAPEPWFATSW